VEKGGVDWSSWLCKPGLGDLCSVEGTVEIGVVSDEGAGEVGVMRDGGAAGGGERVCQSCEFVHWECVFGWPVGE